MLLGPVPVVGFANDTPAKVVVTKASAIRKAKLGFILSDAESFITQRDIFGYIKPPFSIKIKHYALMRRTAELKKERKQARTTVP